MKTLKLLFAAAVLMIGLSACTSENVTHDATVIPKNARDIISQNFTSAISVVKEEKSMGSVSEYEVTLTDGTDISFNANGDWKSVETPVSRAVPEGLIPTAISRYVKEKHAGAYIDGIEKNKKGYEVDLSNGVDIQFDSSGNFVSYSK